MLEQLLTINMTKDFTKEEYKIILDELFTETECIKFEIDKDYDSAFLKSVKESLNTKIKDNPVGYLETKTELELTDWVYIYTIKNRKRFKDIEVEYTVYMNMIEKYYKANVNMIKDEASHYYPEIFKLVHDKLFYKGKEVTGLSELFLYLN